MVINIETKATKKAMVIIKAPNFKKIRVNKTDIHKNGSRYILIICLS
jgi:hypothetical protein